MDQIGILSIAKRTTMFVNKWFKSGTTIVLDKLFEGFSSNGLDIRYNANVGFGITYHNQLKININENNKIISNLSIGCIKHGS